MTTNSSRTARSGCEGPVALTPDGLGVLIDVLIRQGYRVLGPVEKNGTVVYDTVTSLNQLPVGLTDVQEGGHYRLTHTGGPSLFGFAHGAGSLKPHLHRPRQKLFSARGAAENGFEVHEEDEEVRPLAVLGVRSCDLESVDILDRVFLRGEFRDTWYERQRRDMFTVAVNCTVPGGTCFCTSMGTGPEASSGYDLCMTEVVQDDHHVFIMKSGTEKGAAVLAQLPHAPAADALVEAARRQVADCAGKMGRNLETAGLKTLLYENMNHERWQHVADRCLTCGNCTMVCPTCFCTTVEDSTGLDGQTAERWRKWDSCFTLDFAYIHGGSVRATARSRYRQWMTHKLASWEDQFGRSGCVGCGRCITWCPVGIDITEEVAAMRGGRGSKDAEGNNKEHDNGDTEP